MIKKSFTCILLFLLGWTAAHAAIEPYEQQLRGKLKKGDTLIVKDEKFRNPAYDWNSIRNKSVTNIITFGLYRDSMIVLDKPFVCDLDLKVEYWSQPDQETPITIAHVPLKISYDTAQGAVFQAQSVYNFNNAYRVKITINEISSQELGSELPPVFTLTGQVIVDRQYTSSLAPIVPYVFMVNTENKEGDDGGAERAMLLDGITQTSSQVSVNWTKQPGEEEYDLEWTYIDENSVWGNVLNTSGTGTTPAVLAPMFRNNATRVTISRQQYDISLVHSSKYLLIRIRSVAYSGNDRIEQPWSYEVNSGGSVVSGVIILNNTWHEPGLNWQYSASYAEEGKKKEVVSYFDGTLRNRQSVTVSQMGIVGGTDKYKVVQENIYDEFGRKAASVLPAPMAGEQLAYETGATKTATGAAYTYANVYKGNSASCFTIPDPLGNTAGAGKYYSSANSFLAEASFNKYIPDAEGYPLAITAYTPDNTGRVSLQGGVGPTFQPNAGGQTGNKVTRYYYGKPEQWELDRLFGNDVGYAHHYLKNMVIDPNGQISVSYVNASGKTIATALAGAPPRNTAALSLMPEAKTEESPLLAPDSFVFDSVTLKMSGNTTFLAAVPDSGAKITYNIDQLIKQYTEKNVTICSNCYYELKIRVYDDCNTQVYENTQSIKIGSATSNCGLNGINSGSINVPMNKIGTYYISFEMGLNQDVINAYTEDFIVRNTNLKTLFYFIQEELKRTNFLGCYEDCQTCSAALGTKSDFVANLTERLKTGEVNLIPYTNNIKAWAEGLYDELYGRCQYLRAVCTPSPCDRLEALLKADVSPGGQYALFDAQGTPLEATIHILALYWRTEFPVYAATDARYQENLLQRTDESYTSPNDAAFTLQDLVQYWKPEWAARFIKYHPEYCALTYCNSNKTYFEWDERVQKLYPTAASVIDLKPRLEYLVNNPSWLLAADPFFASGSAGNSYYTRFKSDLDNYSRQVLKVTDTRLNNKGLTQFVDYQLYCSDSTGNTNSSTIVALSDRWNKCVPDGSCRVADRQWELYRQKYFELKEKYYAEARSSICTTACKVGATVPLVWTPPPPTGGRVVKCGDIKMSDFTLTVVSGPADDDIYICYDSLLTKPIPPGMRITVNYKYQKNGSNEFKSNVPIGPLSFCNINGQPGLGYEIKRPGEGRVLDAELWGTVGCNDACVADGITNADFSVSYIGTTGQPNLFKISYLGGYQKPIRDGITLIAHVNLRKLDGSIVKVTRQFTKDSLAYQEINAYRVDAEDGIPVWIDYIECTAPSCPPEYGGKISRINAVNYNQALSTDTTKLRQDGEALLDSILNVNCNNMADAWIAQLTPCLASYSSGVKNTLRTQMYQVLRLSADKDHLYGASTTNGALTTGGYNSVAAAIKGVLGIAKFSMLCNPWVLSMPYPANVKGQSVEKILSVTTSDICTKLNALKQAHTNTTISFHKYLKDKYGDGMQISEDDLNALLKGCTNCRYLLDTDVKLPVFMDATATGCITATAFTAEQAIFNGLWSDLDVTNPGYELIFSNYMNQRWGFSLGYGRYKDFMDKIALNPATTELLCNVPVYTTEEKDPYDCVLTLARAAIAAGAKQYAAYIDSVKRDFRKQYVIECSATQARIRAVTKQQLYHFTLYYYDQAGNLVRTVPPAGVALLEGSQLEQVRAIRKLKTVTCNYNGPTDNTFGGTGLQQLNYALGADNQAIEMWLYNNGTGPAQVVTATRQFLFNICVDGRYLYGDIYTLDKQTNAVNMASSNHVAADMGALIPLRQWTHVVLQSSKWIGSPISVYVNGMLCPQAYDAPKGSCISEARIGNGQLAISQNLSFLKHLRLYQRQLTSAEILANAQEPCLSISEKYLSALNTHLRYWARFNTPEPGGGTTIPGGGTTEQQYTALYPNHHMVTDYTYNAQNQVVKQYTPDAKLSKFWYDKSGRLFASQNSKQAEELTYSYTKHDEQNRITEVGQSIMAILPDDDGSNAAAFLSSGTKQQLTQTFYDVPATGSYPQENLRKRVAYTLTYNPPDVATYQYTYYSYDIAGNVKTLTQVLNGLGAKQIDYKYDLVSGKVNTVRYQPGGKDKFYYGYEYDAENRLTKAMSGISSVSADQWSIQNPVTDAYYQYYKHGPLARMVLGDYTVQGVDYAYTLQGWLKGINGNYLQPANEMGQDGHTGVPTVTVGKDAMALTLDYFTDDYKPIGTNTAFPLKWGATAGDSIGRDLFNGNISRSVLSLTELENGKPVGYSYGYDQLNRLQQMRQHPLTAGATTWGASSVQQAYQEDITYDGNGNILTYLRNGQGSTAFPLAMDNLTYHYKLGTNQLDYIDDAITNNNSISVDLKSQLAANYSYDSIGNMVSDTEGGVVSIEWTVYGKIQRIKKSNNHVLKYLYDAAGNRVYKEESSGTGINKTWYVRDAQGNTLAVYGNRNGDNNIYWKEQHLYGSSRLGMWLPDMPVTSDTASQLWTRAALKRYELNNHLGNVLASISDKKLTQSGVYTAEVVNAGDYTPFGMPMVGRQYSLGGVKYRFGFNGKENDNEIKGEGNQQDYGFRIYDPRVGRFLSVDPITSKYPELTPYQFASNRPIDGIDLDGLEWSPPLKADPKTGKMVVDAAGAVSSHTAKENQTTVVIAADILLTKGWMSRLFLVTQAASIVEHNTAKTPEGKIAQNERGQTALFGTLFGLGMNRLVKRSINLVTPKEEIKYLFRGTSEGYPGNRSAQITESTPTSPDPGVGTIFAINSSNYGKGVLQIALPKSLKNVEIGVANNVLADMEAEVVVGLKPLEFAQKAHITITAEQSRGILKGMGINLPARISNSSMNDVLKNTPRLTEKQIDEFYKQAASIQSK
ncbi:RHS repeat-associated core domain-containing protein [Chitinophaga defluvii]|uniref:RHS repeat-associated core domain-containing protein n=1 Tax=Chitinophaga defluvii TaxID=3163343 RepID=A0ABV2T4J9_9BACT